MLFTLACYWITLFEIFLTKTNNYFKIPFKKFTVNKIAWRKALFNEKFEGVAVNLRKQVFRISGWKVSKCEIFSGPYLETIHAVNTSAHAVPTTVFIECSGAYLGPVKDLKWNFI